MTPLDKLYNIYRAAVKKLAAAGCEDAEFDARQLVEYALGYNKTQLLLKSGELIDDARTILFEDCVERRCKREPLQYILGSWGFNRFNFKVGEGVLIPRPETELLPEFAVDLMRKKPCAVVYDLCCGSGCIGITVAKLFPTVRVFCIDYSDKAIEYTNKNRELLMADNVTVIKADVFDPLACPSLPGPDLILSNPPYIPSAELAALQPEVHFEPDMALDGGQDGLDFYRAIADNWFLFLSKGGYLAVECGENQAHDILGMFLETADGAKIIKDGAGIERVVVIKR